MRYFQDTFGTPKRSFISAFSIYITVPLIFDCVYSLYCKCYKKDFERGGSYIDSSD